MVATTPVFNHQRLDVYRVALEFVAWQRHAGAVGPLKLQLERASESIVLNLAEGAAQQTIAMSKRHYRVALGSAGECAAALDLLQLRGGKIEEGRSLIDRVGMMLRRLAR